MKKLSAELAVGFLLILGLVLPLAQTASAYSISGAAGQACSGVDEVSGDTTCSTGAGSTSSISPIITTGIDIFSVIVGIIAVIMVIIAGVKFMTSGGESSKVAAAKQALIYAIIGIVVVALAQVLVHFVLAQATSVTNPPKH